MRRRLAPIAVTLFGSLALAGRNRTKFSGKLRGPRLRPGRYRAVAVATDGAGARSAPKSVGFRIVRAR